MPTLALQQYWATTPAPRPACPLPLHLHLVPSPHPNLPHPETQPLPRASHSSIPAAPISSPQPGPCLAAPAGPSGPKPSSTRQTVTDVHWLEWPRGWGAGCPAHRAWHQVCAQEISFQWHSDETGQGRKPEGQKARNQGIEMGSSQQGWEPGAEGQGWRERGEWSREPEGQRDGGLRHRNREGQGIKWTRKWAQNGREVGD